MYGQTIGASVTINRDKFTVDIALYIQGGRAPSAFLNGKIDLSSYYLAANTKLSITDQLKVGAGFELLYGNDQGATSATDKSFKPF